MKIRLYQRQVMGDYIDTKILTVENATPVEFDKMLALFDDGPVMVAKELDSESAEKLRVAIEKHLQEQRNEEIAWHLKQSAERE